MARRPVCCLVVLCCVFCWGLGCNSPGTDVSAGDQPAASDASADAANSAAEDGAEDSVAPVDAPADTSAKPSLAASPQAAAAPAGEKAKPRFRALLIGCTTYDDMDAPLVGPGNDVFLIRDLLTEKFGFSADDMAILAESFGDPVRRPTRANIVREIEDLVENAAELDQIVIHFAGHGYWQTDDDPQSEEDLEPDGRDELLCPADVKPEFDADGNVVNAITDDQLRDWLGQILEKGASVWFIADSCHSGSVSRGDGKRRFRSLRARHFRANESDTEQPGGAAAPRLVSRGFGRESVAIDLPTSEKAKGKLVALYAAQPYEETFEQVFPIDDEDGNSYGILTYTLCQALRNAEVGMSYEQLVQEIHQRYRSMGVDRPTPFVEGDATDQEVLGTRPAGRTEFAIRRDGEDYRLNAGSLHDVTVGSVLAVYGLPRKEKEEPVGFVRVVDVSPLESTVLPCEHEAVPAPDGIPELNRCETVYVDLGQRELVVAIDPLTDSGAPLDEDRLQAAKERLAAFSKADQSLIRVVDDAAEADWLVRARGAEWVLVPAGDTPGQPPEADPLDIPKVYGPIPEDEMAEWLGLRLERIARAVNLKRIASTQVGDTGLASAIDVDVRLVRFPSKADGVKKQRGVEEKLSPATSLRAGDVIGFKVSNKSDVPVDVCLLFIDSAYGIQQFYPLPGRLDNRLSKWDADTPSFITNAGAVDADTQGREYLAVVAMKAQEQRQPLSLEFLNQPSVEQAEVKLQRKIPRALRNPLERLLAFTAFKDEGTRGINLLDVEENGFRLQLLEWETKP
ncbi:MAG: caspase family protein [Pirellulaceae bacterium]